MSFVEQTAGPEQQTEAEPVAESVAERRGTASLTLGIAAVAMIGCPFLPEGLPPWIRYFPVYLVLPVGIMAVVCGLPDLWAVRGDAGAARGRSLTGVALGTVAILVPLAACLYLVLLLGP
ncbi:hypothetical protein OG594_21435 [Streptomyces sp. NBC_01214]|uniref:hypothetical protein n=1 Tax=Streptomyces sp. NBC_01214 TaxID=2903777 RepID=UPI0022560DE7|nr:hypothetical protein [Streptomyces sp. NBC_01214]MCX4804171.1 hypothetical protein [Streptomyces sp. NBC_01214]